ncbi:MAG: 2-C-methyl-D-erythritol 4-phosphate cytidylyltransferase [Bacteroidetes bacterium]|jgi:2-C-methyl-D-erythritol 4-phosphate cytidylyltransferase|nr:2-C-methyl-D-erythritol 4-phosphate cytidylyltransferase [Bacteroidota bacterium]
MAKPEAVIIVAGGRGERMNANIPKQFLLLGGRPILMHTIEAFHRFNNSMPLVVVLPSAQISYWEELCKKHAFTIGHTVVAGGDNRFQSVKQGLSVVQLPALVAVHDGVRPLVSSRTIERCFGAADAYDAAIPVMDVVESIRQVDENGSKALDRTRIKTVQTPQVFDGELLTKAYKQDFSPFFTDDASVVEAYGKQVTLVEGNSENIKITTAIDLQIAEMLLPVLNR